MTNARCSRALRYTLEQWGFEVWLAESARQALRTLSTEHVLPDLILSDYRLRGDDDGVDVIAAIREALASEVPALIITGDTTPEPLNEVATRQPSGAAQARCSRWSCAPRDRWPAAQ